MRILLITYTPKLYSPFEDTRDLRYAVEFCDEPCGLLLVGAMISQDHDVRILNMFFDPDLEDILASFKPHLAGVTFLTFSGIYDGFEILERIRKYNSEIFTVVGGYGPNGFPELFNQEYIDAVVIGEGEITFKELVDTVERGGDYRKVQGIAYRENGNLVFTEPRPAIENIDDLPLADRRLYDRYYGKRGFMFYSKPAEWVYSSRGCRYNCKFCSIYMKKPVRMHSPERVVEEIENTKAPTVIFADSDFLIDEERAGKIAELVKERGIEKEKFVFETNGRSIAQYPHIIEKWREVAELTVGMGFESVDQKYLRKVGRPLLVEEYKKTLKILYDLNVPVSITFNAFAEFDEADFDRVFDFVCKLEGNVTPTFTVFTPLPGSQLYKEKGHEIVTNDWRLFDLRHLVLPSRLPLERFYKHCRKLNDKTIQKLSHTAMAESVENVDMDFLVDLGGAQEMFK